MQYPTSLANIACLLLLCLALPLQAQQYEQVGDYQVHYSAVSTSFLSADVAAEHGIQRSPAMALVNVSVLEALEDGTMRAVNAPVSGKVGTVGDGSPSPLSFRSLRTGDSVSQVAVFRIIEDEPMRFDLEVRHDRNQAPAKVGFIQRFTIDR
ncbi:MULTISPECIES: DUF4426 domain-containing protein [Halomonas]|uniref:DUF4426 domain-containing protein n=1 Tax=Halomonas chromatireducens TaxID=507626 RepID=A0A109UN82_9GAMM|nr:MULTISPECIES: DUF4426 domain-containing protein [Halomonas]AMD02442.1 hypothetical protein LOKO_03399 [Halomonas chromatireducens]MBZ0332514.1 DUF4426 domain-containing protein [Halomonas sp. ANAO-440]